MKQSKFTGLLLCAGLVILLTSCGGTGGEKTATSDSTAAADSAAKAAAAAKAVSTILTTPKNVVIITHKIANYATWLMAYEGHDTARLASGLHNFVIGRGLMDSNMVLVALNSDDSAKAKAFAKNPSLKKAMKKGGVIGVPTISFVTETWRDTAKIDSKLRSKTTFTVKDWDTWFKAFEDGKQERLDHGITDRVVGHDLNDSKKVYLVVAITDTAKAFAYFKSDALKKRREAGGVIGEPARFLFEIAKHY
jgi:hypothetical protein